MAQAVPHLGTRGVLRPGDPPRAARHVPSHPGRRGFPALVRKAAQPALPRRAGGGDPAPRRIAGGGALGDRQGQAGRGHQALASGMRAQSAHEAGQGYGAKYLCRDRGTRRIAPQIPRAGAISAAPSWSSFTRYRTARYRTARAPYRPGEAAHASHRVHAVRYHSVKSTLSGTCLAVFPDRLDPALERLEAYDPTGSLVDRPPR